MESFEYDLDSTSEQLDVWSQKAGFSQPAGVNRPKDNEEFVKGNFGFAGILDTPKKHIILVLSSSLFQCTSFSDRSFGNSEYGRQKGW